MYGYFSDCDEQCYCDGLFEKLRSESCQMLSFDTTDILMTPALLPCLLYSLSYLLLSLLPPPSPYDPSGRVFEGPSVTDNGFWDTFRTGKEDFKHTATTTIFQKISPSRGGAWMHGYYWLQLIISSFWLSSFSLSSVYPMLSLLYPDYLGEIIQGKVQIEWEWVVMVKAKSIGYLQHCILVMVYPLSWNIRGRGECLIWYNFSYDMISRCHSSKSWTWLKDSITESIVSYK